MSTASDLTEEATTGGFRQLFYRDRKAGTTKNVCSLGGNPLNADVFLPSITADGRYAIFGSLGEMVAGGSNGFAQIFLVDVEGDEAILISAANGSAAPGRGNSYPAGMSSDARYVLFASSAPDLVTNQYFDQQFFVRDTINRKTFLVTVGVDGHGADGWISSGQISDDGRYILFGHDAGNLVPERCLRGINDVYIRDMQLQQTRLVSKACNAESGGDDHSFSQVMSRDGRHVAFISQASNLAQGGNQSHGAYQIYLRDVESGRTILVTRNNIDGGYSDFISETPIINNTGDKVFFSSSSFDLVNYFNYWPPQLYVFHNESLPALSLSSRNNVIEASWPSAAGFRLQTKATLDPQEPWKDVSENIRIEGALNVHVTTNPEDATGFFRLNRE